MNAKTYLILLAACFLIAPAFGSSVSPGALDSAGSHRAIPAALLYRKADYKPCQPARNALKFGGLWLSRSADITRFFLGLPMEERE